MKISMHKELERGLNLFNEGKLEEALQLIIKFEDLEDQIKDDKHYCRLLKGLILIHMGKPQESIKIAEQDYEENRNQNISLFLIDSIFLKFGNQFMLARGFKTWEDVVLCEKLLKSVSEEPPFEVELREGFYYYMRGYFYFWERNLDKAMEYQKRALVILEKYDFDKTLIPSILNLLGHIYANKGELENALKYHMQSIEYYQTRFSNSIVGKLLIASSDYSLGDISYQQGNLETALAYHEKSIKSWEQYTHSMAVYWVGINYDSMIRAFLYKNSPEEAQKYLDRFYQFLKKKKISKNFSWYKLSKARTLRSSSRVRERAEAEKSLKELVDEHEGVKSTVTRGIPEEFTLALIELCDFYLEELRLTNDLKIIDDIRPLIIRLLKESERINSYILQAQAHLLYGKISLLQINMGDARRHLTQAQQIAEEHGFQLLAREISTEHDKLLERLNKWEELDKSNAPMSERMALASLEESLDLIQRRRAIKTPELVNEDPILLLIIGEGGILLFSHPFSDEMKVEDEIFGSFLSAIKSFSDEVFSEGLDRAKFGQYTVLIKNIADFSFCYLFKGQTYLAQKKIVNFTENFQKNTSMMQTLNKYNQTSQVIEVKDFPFLEGFINEIFINK